MNYYEYMVTIYDHQTRWLYRMKHILALLARKFRIVYYAKYNLDFPLLSPKLQDILKVITEYTIFFTSFVSSLTFFFLVY